MTIRKRITSSIYTALLEFGLDIRRVKKDILLSGKPFNYVVGNYTLLLPANHALPKMQQRSPVYGHMLTRLAAALQRKYKAFVVIDIGANVGDSTAFIKSGADVPIFCVEGYAPYLEYLMRNAIQWSDVEIIHTFMSDAKGVVRADIEENQGTIRLVDTGRGVQVSVTTLDEFATEHAKAKSATLVKIDTDGYDMRVLRGGMHFIKTHTPTLFFEYQKAYWSHANDGLTILKKLRAVDYRDILFYDCFGELLLATTLDDRNVIDALDDYVTRGEPAIAYYDVCVFHKKESALAHQFITNERAYYQKTRRTADH